MIDTIYILNSANFIIYGHDGHGKNVIGHPRRKFIGIDVPAAIDGQCFGQGDENPDSQCQLCDSINSPTAWANREVGFACDPGWEASIVTRPFSRATLRRVCVPASIVTRLSGPRDTSTWAIASEATRETSKSP